MAHRTASARDLSVVQVRTRVITGLPEQYRGLTIEVSSDKCHLTSSEWSRDPEGVVACEFWARLPAPANGDIDVKVSPLSPWRRPSLSFWAPGRTLFATLNLNVDAAAAAEAQQGRGQEGCGGTWRSVELRLTPRRLVDRLRGVDAYDHDTRIQLDYMLLSLPASVARLPELELATPLLRPLHSYAHGGFMGAALSLLADPLWATALLEISEAEEDNKIQSHISELADLQHGGLTTAKPSMLPLMLLLENSPVLCGYGLVRSGCTQPPAEVVRAWGAGPFPPTGPLQWQLFKLPPSKLPYMLRPHVTPPHLRPLLPRQLEQRPPDATKDEAGAGPGSALEAPGALPPPLPNFNQYGYAPIGMEWDLWLSPDDPAELSLAVVDHGSAGDLVQQAIAMALKCNALAKSMGRRHNRNQGISPMRWLREFAASINGAVNGAPDKPLPLWGPPATTTATAATAGAAPPPLPLPYPDGSQCPSLERFMRVGLEALAVRLAPQEQERMSKAVLAVRVRLVGNTYTHGPLWLEKFLEHEEDGGGGGGGEAAGQGPEAAVAGPGQAKDMGKVAAAAKAKLHVCKDFVEGEAGGGGGKDGGGGGKGGAAWHRHSFYPTQPADLDRSLLVLEVVSGNSLSSPLARALVPLGLLAGRGEGALTLTAALHPRKVKPQTDADPGPVAVAEGAIPPGDTGEDAAAAAAVIPVAARLRFGPSGPPAAPLPESGMTRDAPAAGTRQGSSQTGGATGRWNGEVTSGLGPVAEGREEGGAESPVPVARTSDAAARGRASGTTALDIKAIAQMEMARRQGSATGAMPPGVGHYSRRAGGPSVSSHQTYGTSGSQHFNLPTNRSGRLKGSKGSSGVTGRGGSRRFTDIGRTSRRVAVAPEGDGIVAELARELGPGGLRERLKGLGAGRSGDSDGGGTGGSSSGDDSGDDFLAEHELHVLDEESDSEDEYEGEAGADGASSTGATAAAQALGVDLFVSEDGAAAAAQRQRLVAAGRGAITVTLRWDTLTVLQAAEQLHQLPPHVAQTCIAMLSNPGGLFLDVKSGYSRAAHLRSFASTLAGLGIHVKGMCSFVFKQIDFEDPPPYDSGAATVTTNRSLQPRASTTAATITSTASAASINTMTTTSKPTTTTNPEPPSPGPSPRPALPAPSAAAISGPSLQFGDGKDPGRPVPVGEAMAGGLLAGGKLPGPAPRTFDTVLFFHGLNGLELACEAGRVPEGTCVLFNGASMLLEDPGAAVVPPDNKQAEEELEAAGVGGDEAAQEQEEGERATPGHRGRGDQGPGDGGAEPRSGQLSAGSPKPPGTTREDLHDEKREHEEGGMREAQSRREAVVAVATAEGPGPVAEAVSREDGPSAAADAAAVGAPGAGDSGPAAGGGVKPPRTRREDWAAERNDEELPVLVDREAWRRYCTVVTIFKVYGGIYVQEPDCCPAAVASLIDLTNKHPGFLPLGFAYGHLSQKAVAAAGHAGRGMAAQQLMEELSCRKKLGNKVQKWIRQGVHVGASDQVYLSWGRRLLTSDELLYMRGQQLLLQLLADYGAGDGGVLEQGEELLHLVDGLGGFRFVFSRFHKHYEATSPFTFLEFGFNLNYTKAMLRLLRNRGALAAMSPRDKADTAVWLATDPSLRLWVQRCFLRAGRHKHIKEALVCLVESSTEKEFQQICAALGGFPVLRRALRGWTFIFGWTYTRRIKAAQAFWAAGKADSSLIAAGACTYGFVHYVRRLPEGGIEPGQGLDQEVYNHPPVTGGKVPRLPRVWMGPDGVLVTSDPTFTRHKTWVWTFWRLLHKWFCCAATCCCHFFLCCGTCGCCYAVCCCPVLWYPYCRSRWLPYVVAILGVVLSYLLIAGVLGGNLQVRLGSKS